MSRKIPNFCPTQYPKQCLIRNNFAITYNVTYCLIRNRGTAEKRRTLLIKCNYKLTMGEINGKYCLDRRRHRRHRR